MSGIVGTIHVSAATVGSSAVTVAKTKIASSTTRATLITPSSGKRVRIISVQTRWGATALARLETYFGSGANITTTNANAIFDPLLDLDSQPTASQTWPDGAGSVGAVDAVVSVRVSVSNVEDAGWIVVYREE